MLERIRGACAWVAERSRSVRIAHDRIDVYARSLPLEALRAPSLDPATHYVREPAGTLAFVLTLDAINFGSGYFPHMRKRPGMSGYFTVAASLKDRFDREGPFSPAELQGLDAHACADLFGQDTSNPTSMELMGLFAQALNDLGRFAKNGYRELVDRSNGSAEKLVEVLSEMPFYRDVSTYQGEDVPFYKRAQLTGADLQTAGVAEFNDLDRLTIFADNLVPHVLRLDGVLLFDTDLVQRIEREDLIVSGSREEIEIRACAVHAVELIAQVLDGITPMQLDYLLWNRGQQPTYKARPRHRARSVYY